MTSTELHRRLDAQFAPVMDDLAARAAVTDHMLDRDIYRILVATLWVNVVLAPEDAGLEERQLETLHDVINARIEPVLGAGESLRSCFRYLNGRDGERAMKEARLPPNHRDMLLYFASIILDPEGHRRWMDAIRNDPRR
ncbi:MAG: hypothetical protein CMQ43_08230 [Gammaproteobacteria bacterium]|nr:hypothetical protein [Gammaproteobacteria bacterium]|tara:strand:+ start:148 stop:564 length:417 start_codon:yes stop_codon:yes gene_type:complete